MAEDIPLSLVFDNPFNSRKQYDHVGIEQLAKSLRQNGLLNPVTVRRTDGKYELVFGHRRTRAARLLDWEKIRAEIVSSTDEQMLQISLVENLHRENLSDFETALCFRRLLSEFGKTYEQIGDLVGFSKSHIAGYIRMTQLFDDETADRFPEIITDLYKISEHHARVLAQIPDQRERLRALRIVATENLSVRDLQKMIQRLPGWFSSIKGDPDSARSQIERGILESMSNNNEESKIQQIVRARFGSSYRDDFQSFTDCHDWSVYSLFTSCPPFDRFESERAALREKELYGGLSHHLRRKVRDVRIQIFGSIALVTLTQDHKVGMQKSTKRGTVVFRKLDTWKIVHEHWSKCEEEFVSQRLTT